MEGGGRVEVYTERGRRKKREKRGSKGERGGVEGEGVLWIAKTTITGDCTLNRLSIIAR